jgi:hypothetical protein
MQSSLTFVSGLPIEAIASRTFADVIANGGPGPSSSTRRGEARDRPRQSTQPRR